VWYIRQIKLDGPLILKESDNLVNSVMPHLGFLATNYAIRLTIFLMKYLSYAIKLLFIPGMPAAAFWTVLIAGISWMFLYNRRKDNVPTLSAVVLANLVKSIDSAEGPSYVKVPLYTLVRGAWVVAAIEHTLRPGLPKLLQLWNSITQLLGSKLRSLSSLLSRICMQIFKNRSTTFTGYQHSRINTKREVRLVILHRRLPYFPIRVTLQHFHLEFMPPYEAISYTWGSAEKNSQVFINGVPFLTTASAFSVLRSRSSIWRTRLIWIDSICINQDDDQEKGQQVGLMGDIYRGCSRAVIWLGDWEDFIMSFGGPALIRDLVDRGLGLLDFQRHKNIGDIRMFLNLVRLPALIKILSHPWFQRVWVVQEVALPPKVHVVYGGQYLEWDSLEEIARMFSTPEGAALLQNTAATRLALVGVRNISNMASIRVNTNIQGKINHLQNTCAAIGIPNLHKRNKMLPLAGLLKQFVSLNSTNALDKVYALLSLTSDGSNRVIIPDYRKSPQLLFTEVAQHFVSTGDPFSILSSAGIGHERTVNDLPSWVPDWTTPTIAADLNFGDPEICRGAYRASGRSQFQMTVRQDGKSLRAAAIYLDEIKELGAHDRQFADDDLFHVDAEGHAFNTGDYKLHRKLYTEAWHLATTHARPPLRRRSDLREAFWRTLCGDTDVTSRPAPPKFEIYFSSWLKLMDKVDEFILEDGSLKSLPEDEEFWDLVGDTSPWGVAMGQGCSQRKFCVTREGYIGLAPLRTMIGDEIWVFLGAPTPYVLRKETSGERDSNENGEREFKLVGECYVDEMMDGEIFEVGRGVEHVILE
jgi:hypothetical protein